MKRLLLTVFLVVTLVCVSFVYGTVHFCRAQSGTSVSGIIGSGTTWASAGSPYNLTGNILVNSGVTLTVGSGTTLNLNGFYIIVNGSLIIEQGDTVNMGNTTAYVLVNGVLSAIGTNSNPIQINGNGPNFVSYPQAVYPTITFSKSSTGWNSATNSGSIIENVAVNLVEIDVYSSVKISDDTINGGEPNQYGYTPTISFLGGSSLIYANSVSNLIIGLYGGNCSVTNNEIINGSFGFTSGDTTIANNIISNSQRYNPNSNAGIGFEAGGGGLNGHILQVENNLITGYANGIQILSPSEGIAGAPSILTIQNNTIANNSVGLYLSNSFVPTIAHNNIENNTLNMELAKDPSGQSSSFSASNNWWGTANQDAINQSIYDFKDDFTLGVVTFVPFLTSENPEAMPNLSAPIPNLTPSPSPMPSPTVTPSPSVPEFPLTAIAITFLTIAVLVGVILKRKQIKGN